MTLPDPEPQFFYVVTPKKVEVGDVLYEINDNPLRGGPMTIATVRRMPADPGKGTCAGWELVPVSSRFSRFVDSDARLKVGRFAPIHHINPIVAAAARPRRAAKRAKSAPPDQLALFDTPVEGT